MLHLYCSFFSLVMLLSRVQLQSLIFLMLLFSTITNLNPVYISYKDKGGNMREWNPPWLEVRNQGWVGLHHPLSCVTFGKSLMSLVSTRLKFRVTISLKPIVWGWNKLQKLSPLSHSLSLMALTGCQIVRLYGKRAVSR